MKKCNSCKTEKDITEFNRDSNSRDGHRNECRACHKIQNARWYDKNRELLLPRNRKWKHENRDKTLAATKRWQKKQFETNSNYALAHSLRTRLNMAIKNNFKAGSAVRDLGCSIEEFRKYIESQFKPGMSWDNRGKWGEVWHIDHIKPLNKFDLTNREQFMEACHYTNMQPMWALDNIIKSDWS